jgi:hypothetical protein
MKTYVKSRGTLKQMKAIYKIDSKNELGAGSYGTVFKAESIEDPS